MSAIFQLLEPVGFDGRLVASLEKSYSRLALFVSGLLIWLTSIAFACAFGYLAYISAAPAFKHSVTILAWVTAFVLIICLQRMFITMGGYFREAHCAGKPVENWKPWRIRLVGMAIISLIASQPLLLLIDRASIDEKISEEKKLKIEIFKSSELQSIQKQEHFQLQLKSRITGKVPDGMASDRGVNLEKVQGCAMNDYACLQTELIWVNADLARLKNERNEIESSLDWYKSHLDHSGLLTERLIVLWSSRSTLKNVLLTALVAFLLMSGDLLRDIFSKPLRDYEKARYDQETEFLMAERSNTEHYMASNIQKFRDREMDADRYVADPIEGKSAEPRKPRVVTTDSEMFLKAFSAPKSDSVIDEEKVEK